MPATHIDRLLSGLAVHGLTRSDDQSVAVFLAILREYNLLSEAERNAFLKSYHAARFGTGDAENGLEKAVASLLAEVAHNVETHPSSLEACRKALIRLSPPPVEDEKALASDPITTSEVVRDREPPDDETEDEDLDAEEASKAPRYWLVIGILVAYAVLATIGIAYLLLRPEEPAVVHGRPAPADPLARSRAAAFSSPGDIDAWWSYINEARRHNRPGDELVGYEHLVMTFPTNAEGYNGLAWLLCTTERTSLHDCDRALPYAKRAVDLRDAPHIMDTLAEALFQAGDIRTAIDLEEAAILRVERTEHYERQLERFRAHLPPE